MNKKVIIIVAVVLIIAIIAIIVYIATSSSKPSSKEESKVASKEESKVASKEESKVASKEESKVASSETTTGGGITFVQITRPSINNGWYPYGATANFVKSTIGVTNLESAISYAKSKGYSAFSFNESSTSTDPTDNNSKILFFTEPDINASTFFTSGAALPGFKVYAARDSKLKSSETFSFNIPQYLRHLQNKNYLLY